MYEGEKEMVGKLESIPSSNLSISSSAKTTAEISSAVGADGKRLKSYSQQPQVYPKEQIEKVVSGMNDFLKASPNTNLKFEFHDKLNEYYVTIVNEETKEIVKEIPPKKLLDMFAAMTEFLGLMVDKKI